MLFDIDEKSIRLTATGFFNGFQQSPYLKSSLAGSSMASKAANVASSGGGIGRTIGRVKRIPDWVKWKSKYAGRGIAEGFKNPYLLLGLAGVSALAGLANRRDKEGRQR